MAGSTCDVCGTEPSVSVGAMPGVPASFAYCKGCLKAGAHPYAIVVANTAMIGGMDEAAPWWQELVQRTLDHLGKTREEFDASVVADMQEFAEAEERAQAEFATAEERGLVCPPGCVGLHGHPERES